MTDTSKKTDPKSFLSKTNPSLEVLWGDKVTALMRRDDVNEIYINEDGYVWYDSHTDGKVKTSIYLNPITARAIIEVVAGQIQKIVNENIPSISAEVSGYGARFQGELPPIVRNPEFNIRKKAIKIFTLDDYVKNGTLSQTYKDYLVNAIKNRKNILVVGGTGTGKTTFLNATLDAIAKLTPDHRIISLEDTPELQCSAKDYSAMYTKQDVGDTKFPPYNMTRLLADCMRRSPDRIVVGEVRDGCAYSMLKAWNTGHEGGCCTVHANSAEQGLDRIESLCYEDKSAAGDIRRLIGEAIDVVVSIVYVRLPTGQKGRIIDDIIEVHDYDRSTQRYDLQHIPNDDITLKRA